MPPRFFVPPSLSTTERFPLPSDEAHHAAHVFRLAVGDPIEVLDGEGARLSCEIAAVTKRQTEVRVRARNAPPPAPPPLILLLAVTKAKAMDQALQQSTELGVSLVVPLLARRSVVHIDDATAAQKLERWRRTTIEALKQCGGLWLPRIEPPRTVEAELREPARAELEVLAALSADARAPRAVFDESTRRLGRSPASVAVWVGPEGDFDAEELAAIRTGRAAPIRLGPWVLRSETAAIAALAILGSELRLATPR